jgi:hypothetical protein
MVNNNKIKLLFASDLIPPETSECIYSNEFLEVLRDKDFSIVNLEALLTTTMEKIVKTGNNFKVPRESVQHIVDGQFGGVALSNNHIRDFGDQGVIDTIETCRAQGVLTVGAGSNVREASQPLVVSLKQKRIAFLNYSEREFNAASKTRAGANPFDVIDAFSDVREAKAKADCVIVIYHGGIEYQYYPTLEMIRRFKFLVDIGADCVVAHHTHRYSGLIEYRKKPIFFGLGNFLAATRGKAIDEWRNGLIARIEIGDNDIRAEVIPTIMSRDFNSVDLMHGSEKEEVLAHVAAISKTINDDEAIAGYWKRAYAGERERVMNLLKSDSLWEYRLRKHLSGVLKPGVSQYKLLNILNLIRCDSLREMVLEILEAEYSRRAAR